MRVDVAGVLIRSLACTILAQFKLTIVANILLMELYDATSSLCVAIS